MEVDPQRSAQHIADLCRILGNDFRRDLASALSNAPRGSSLQLRIEGRLSDAANAPRDGEYSKDGSRFLMGNINLGELQTPIPTVSASHANLEGQSTVDDQVSNPHPAFVLAFISDEAQTQPEAYNHQKVSEAVPPEFPIHSPRASCPNPEAQQFTVDKQTLSRHPAFLPSPVSDDVEEDGPPVHKRRKFVGGLRLKRDGRSPVKKTSARSAADSECGTQSSQEEKSTSCRKTHIDTRFPQRNTTKDPAVPTLEPSSADKLVAGIWRQIHSNVQLIPTDLTSQATDATNSFSVTNLHSTLNKEAFQAVNNLCLRYYNQSQLTRALEMIVQAYWVECYEARILALKQDNPTKSSTEANMDALREACSVFSWSEKELRNRFNLRAHPRSIWRGYKEIKDMGGWVSIVFASWGIYRFCKYRNSFNKGLTSQLRSLRSSFEVAADTLHPEWRNLLEVIGQRSVPLYDGHPHAWVISGNKLPQRLCSTYRKPEEFNFQFIEESVIDTQVWGSDDPRQEPSIDPDLCPDCEQDQSDNVENNRCRCFPNLYPRPQSAVPLQICSMANGKNNGVVACCV